MFSLTFVFICCNILECKQRATKLEWTMTNRNLFSQKYPPPTSRSQWLCFQFSCIEQTIVILVHNIIYSCSEATWRRPFVVQDQSITCLLLKSWATVCVSVEDKWFILLSKVVRYILFRYEESISISLSKFIYFGKQMHWKGRQRPLLPSVPKNQFSFFLFL